MLVVLSYIQRFRKIHFRRSTDTTAPKMMPEPASVSVSNAPIQPTTAPPIAHFSSNDVQPFLLYSFRSSRSLNYSTIRRYSIMVSNRLLTGIGITLKSDGYVEFGLFISFFYSIPCLSSHNGQTSFDLKVHTDTKWTHLGVHQFGGIQ